MCIIFTTVQGHGFGTNTLIELANGSQKTIHAICRHTLRNPISVASYDLDGLRIIHQPIKMGKRAEPIVTFNSALMISLMQQVILYALPRKSFMYLQSVDGFLHINCN